MSAEEEARRLAGCAEKLEQRAGEIRGFALDLAEALGELSRAGHEAPGLGDLPRLTDAIDHLTAMAEKIVEAGKRLRVN